MTDPLNIENTGSWDTLRLSPETLEFVKKAGYTSPTPIQSKAIPVALEGKDVIASAQTGTGKTASFVLPMVERFVGRRGCLGLILAPTREIAQQINETLEIFAKPRGLSSVVLIGGIDMDIDFKALKTYPDIIVATPGRLCDHIERGTIWLDFIEIFVLDEADRMLSMGFSKNLDLIMSHLPESRQTLMFSATFLPSVEALAKKALKQPERIMAGKTSSARPSIEQRIIWIREEDKRRALMQFIRDEKGSIMIFTKSKDSAQKLWFYMHSQEIYDAIYISSDRMQSQREQALAEFKSGQYRILIATDVAGRGIHVEGVAHVLNYDLPMDPEDYIHRIGRTGRAGATGKATSYVTSRERELLGDIERILGYRIPSIGSPPPREHYGSRNDHGNGPRHGNGPIRSNNQGPRRTDDRKKPFRPRGTKPRRDNSGNQ